MNLTPVTIGWAEAMNSGATGGDRSPRATEKSTEIGAVLRSPPAFVAPYLLLLLAESPSHGYQLTERLQQFGCFGGGPGRLYRDLRRMEEAGLVVSYWESTEHRGPARRVYELTPSGRETLLLCAEEAKQLIRTLQLYVRRVGSAPGSRSASWRPSPRRPRG